MGHTFLFLQGELNMKKIIAVFLSAALLLSVLAAAPYTVSAANTTAEEAVGESNGTTGDCCWILDDDGVLTIYGNGKMGDYSSSIAAPWEKSIKSVVIEQGVTSIGKGAFNGCTKITMHFTSVQD